MKNKRKTLIGRLNDQQGAVAVTVSLFLIALFGMAALAFDVGHALVARNQLQNASDAAALAGARALGLIYGANSGSMTGYTLTSGNIASIAAAASTAGADNKAAGVTVTVNAADIATGNWDGGTRTFAPTTVLPRAVRVITRLDGTANGPISTLLAKVLGKTSVSVTAVATARLNPVSIMAPGDLNAPFGISEAFFSQFTCGDTIQFAPNDPGNLQACGGLTAFDQGANTNNIRDITNGLANGTYTPPAEGIGDPINMTNSNSAAVWVALKNLWQTQMANNGAWNAYIPVYAGTDCSPNVENVAGFATVNITYVGKPGDPGNSVCSGSNTNTGCIRGVVQCNVFQGNGGSGGGSFGTYGTIPGLVE